MGREIVWLGSTLEELRAFPEDVRGEVGHALFEAQCGRKHVSATPMQGFGGASVLEIRADDASGTYRTVYTVKLEDAVYVLHAFQKKSTRGIATSQRDMDLIRQRLKEAETLSAQSTTGGRPTGGKRP